MLKEIPMNSTQIQEGLWLNSYTKNINGTTYVFRHLYSSVGYCFYDKTQEVYREVNGENIKVEEKDILPNERIYMKFASLGLIANIDDYVSVKIEEGFEIV